MQALFAFFGMPGHWELLLLGVIILLLFGSTRLPSLMRNLGRSATEFQKGMKGVGDEDESDDKEENEK